jgi:hypothetical protein
MSEATVEYFEQPDYLRRLGGLCGLAGALLFFAFAAFFILMVGGSAVHPLWTAKGLALKYCYGQGSTCSDLLTVTKSYWTLAYNLSSIPGYLGGLILMSLVLTGRTW